MNSRVLTFVVLALTALFSTTTIVAGSNQINLHTVELSTGINMEYAEKGNNGQGHVVIFLHGYLDSWYAWSEVMNLMPKKYHCYSITHRGHGESSKPENGYEISDYSEDLLAFMDEMGIHRADLIGHSMGSLIAQRFAIDHPDRTKNIVLVGSGADGASNQELSAWQGFVGDLEGDHPYTVAELDEFVASIFYTVFPGDFIYQLALEEYKAPANTWKKGLEGLLNHDTRGELQYIQAPTLILWGDKDFIFLANDQEDLMEGIPNYKFVVYENTGHAMEWEQPGRVASDVIAFIK